jgi:3-hydroxyisobutyrate dehydrogenase-like beta-hydroxyacid dehydrogenase
VNTQRLAFIGLGNMGAGMAGRLLDSGFPVAVFNRTAAKAAPLVESGAEPAATAAEAATGADVVLLSLSDESAVEQVVFGDVVPALKPGVVVIDTSTVSPGYARQAAQRLAAAGTPRVEACVVGNPLQARQGESRIFCAGRPEDVEAVRPILQALGSQVSHVGEAGAAATVKLVFNLVLGAQIATLAEAVNYGVGAGLDREMLLSAIAGSGFSSVVMRFRAELMKQRRYQPPFFRASLMDKDLRLALESAVEIGLTLPVLESVRERFAAVVRAGDGDLDAAVVAEHR